MNHRGTYRWTIFGLALILSLVWNITSTKECIESTTQTTIELNFYNNGTTENEFAVTNLMLDSSSNQYLYFAFPGTDNNTHIAKKSSDGTQLWVKEYPGFYFKRGYRNTQMSKDESVIRILGESLSDIIQFIEISTSDGAVTSAYETTGSNRMASFWHQSNIDCSNTTNTICYYIGRGSATLAYTLSKFDFSSPGTIALLDPDSFTSVYTSVAVLSDNEVLVTGIDTTPAVDEHFFFKLNFTAETYDWTIQTAPNEEAFGGNFDRYTISFLSDAFTQFYTIFR